MTALSTPAAAIAGCTATPPTASVASSTTSGLGASGNASPVTTTPSSYATVADLAKALNDKGIPCVLSYPGLKDDVSQAELSVCTIDDEQAFLRVWHGTDQVKKFLATPDGQSGTLAVGGNWTISFQTSAPAVKIATALGGSAPGSATTITTSASASGAT